MKRRARFSVDGREMQMVDTVSLTRPRGWNPTGCLFHSVIELGEAPTSACPYAAPRWVEAIGRACSVLDGLRGPAAAPEVERLFDELFADVRGPDREAALSLLTDPIESGAGGVLDNGSHRVCAMRGQAIAQILVRQV